MEKSSEVKQIGDVQISPQIILLDVLSIPHFKVNFIFVNKITTYMSLDIFFNQNECKFQGFCPKKVTRISRKLRGVYIFRRTENKSCLGFADMV